jgi:hypothetical protein
VVAIVVGGHPGPPPSAVWADGGSGPRGGDGGSSGPDRAGSGGLVPVLANAEQPRGRRPADLIVPLATLLGLAERPGEIHGFGLLDPASPGNWPLPPAPLWPPR